MPIEAGNVIEEAIGKVIEWMLAQGGGYVLAVLAGAYIYVLDRRLVEERKENELQVTAFNTQIREQFEKRLGEYREIMDVMTNSTVTVGAMHKSLTASSDAINQLAAGFAKLLAEFQAQQGRWDDRRGAMAKQLEDLQRGIEFLQRNAGRAA